nr:MAG TPA: hypothetical protein [Caudoviricetes sp.]
MTALFLLWLIISIFYAFFLIFWESSIHCIKLIID